MLPLENTTSGAINEVYDLLQHTDLSLVGELAYPIKHCVLVNDKTDLSQIDTLYSHPQVIQQCSQFIHSLDRVHIEYCESSSHAMQLVASLNKPNIAALGNEDGGKLYGLSVLKLILLIKRTILRVLLWWLKSLAKFHHRFPQRPYY